jgi:thermolysin
VSASRASGVYQLIDLLRPAVAFTLDFRGSTTRLNAFINTGLLSVADIAVSSSNAWEDGALVDAHVYQGWVYDYFYKRFGRRGLDGSDLEIVSIVHPLARANAPVVPPEIAGLWINNAGYVHPGFMIYGDGDGVTYDYLAGALDIVAHELTHGVTAFSSGLEYQDEPGALSEAFSDILATGVEFFHLRPGAGPQRGPNFVVGEDVYLAAPGFTRSLENPMAAGYPDHYSLRRFIGTPLDNGGVHVNSTIVSHAFYLAVNGGRNRVSGMSVPGIGVANIERMERIFYRAFVFMLGPLSQFSDARAATLQAAAELYGENSPERVQLAAAWTAVGVH